MVLLDLKHAIASLSEIERKTLQALEKEKSKGEEEIAKQSALPIDSVRRALQWLKEKNLIELRERSEKGMRLTPAGKSSLRKGLPEKMFVEALQQLGGKASMEEARKKSQLNEPEFHVAMGLAKKNAWISITKGPLHKMGPAGAYITEWVPWLELTGLEKPLLEGAYPLEKALNTVEEGKETGEEEKQELLRRGLAEGFITAERSARLNENGKKALQQLAGTRQRTYNIYGEVPKIMVGKKQPYVQFLLRVRRRLAELGFIEMESPLITQEFYNFDALFQPQDHPARSWSDTYQLKQPKLGKLPDKKIVARVKAAHENGWRTGSKGWQYKWSEEIAKRLMPASHCTAHSARQMVKGIKVPGKYFAVARVFRPEITDATHLVEFNQMEGIIIDEEMNFRKLLGMLEQFAIEFAGAEAVKFVPSYFPFTEPSCQLNAKHPKLGWMELGGSGIFRPELTLPLGIKQPVLAWGIGIDRIAMFKLGIQDIRQLFSDDLNWLRAQKIMVE